MPRDIVKGSSLNFDNSFAPNRAVFSPSFDFTALVFRPLPVPKTKNNISVDQTTDFSTLLHNETFVEEKLGPWFGRDFMVAEFSVLDKRIKLILKHQNDGDIVLTESPIYRLYRFLRPYIKCSKLPNPMDSYYWKLIDKKVWDLFQRQTFIFDVYDPIFIQAAVYVVQSTPQKKIIGLGKNAKSALIMLKRAAKTAFISAIRSANPDKPFYEIVDLEEGCIVSITRAGAEPSLYPRSGNNQGTSYQVKLYHDKYDVFPANLSKYAKEAFLATDTWDTVFTLYDAKEQLEFLKHSDIPAAFIYLALKDYCQLPNEIVKAGRSELSDSRVSEREVEAIAKDNPFDIDLVDTDDGNTNSNENSEEENVFFSALKSLKADSSSEDELNVWDVLKEAPSNDEDDNIGDDEEFQLG